MAETQTKKCTKCGVEKTLEDFTPRHKSKDGRYSSCKRCYADAYKRRRDANPDHERAKCRAYYAKNAERISSRQNAKYHANIDKYRKYHAEWMRNHPEARQAMKKKNMETMSLGYVAMALRIPVSECTPELIELKRQQLTIHRLTKKLKQEIKNVK